MECYKNRGRFLIEAILWWLIIALPINLASIFFSIQAPAYIHTDHINNGTNNVNTSLGIIDLSFASTETKFKNPITKTQNNFLVNTGFLVKLFQKKPK